MKSIQSFDRENDAPRASRTATGAHDLQAPLYRV